MNSILLVKENTIFHFTNFKNKSKIIFIFCVLVICQMGIGQPNIICKTTDDTDKYFQPDFAVSGLESDVLVYGKVQDNSDSNMSDGFIRKISNDCSSSSTMNFDLSPNEKINKIFLTDEGNMLTFSQTIDTDNGFSFTFKGVNCLLLNYEGDLLKSSSFDNNPQERSSIPEMMSNNKVLLSFQHRSPTGVGLAVFNQDCTLEWELTFSEYSDIWAYEIDGNIYAVCSPQMTSQERYLIKLSLDGALISTKLIETNFSQFLSFVRKTADNHLIINSGDQSVSGEIKAVLTKIDLNGNTIWEESFFDETISNQFNGVVDLPDGNMLAYSSFWSNPNKKLKVFKLNNMGEVIWEKNYGGNDKNQYLKVKVIHNDFILLGYTSNAAGDDFEHFGSKDIVLQGIDSNGEAHWVKSYGIFSDEIIKEIIVDGDEFFVSGERNDKSYAQFFSCKIGEPCDDDNPETMFDEIGENCTCKGITECESMDFEALEAFYNNLGGDNWTNSGTIDNPSDESNGWLKDCDVCNWIGITCEDDRVTRVNLNDNNLVGSLPVEIGSLEFLERLFIESNNVIGNIPAEIGLLSNLKYLGLKNNSITGDIPDEMYNATQLIQIDLYNNKFTGSLSQDIRQLTELENLLIGFNEFSGELPTDIGELSNLKRLEFRSNNFSGELPIEIGNLSKLERLQGGGNDISGGIPNEIFMLKNLNMLEFSSNNLTDTLPTNMSECTNLFALLLGDNNLYGTIPADIGELTNLRVLLLYDNDFTGSIPEGIGSLEDINTLYLENNNLEGCVPQSLQLLCGSTDVNISNNPSLNTEDWDSFCDDNVGICPDVHPDYYPLVSFYNSTGGSDWIIQDGWDIGVIDKYSDPCQWYGITCNGEQRVSCIDLDGNANCTGSNEPGNNLIGSFPSAINELIFLEHLYLSNNLISGELPAELFMLESLISLDLRQNQLNGEISSEIANLINARNLNFSGNDFEGTLPSSLEQMTELRSLFIADNQLSGEIPERLGDLLSISIINLSNNNLSGIVPPSLANLSNVSQIALGGNNLSGCLDPILKGLCANNSLIIDGNLLLPWKGNFAAFCNSTGELSDQIGAECSDGDMTNGEEVILEDCTCGFLVSTSDLNNSISFFPNPVHSKLVLKGLEHGQYNYTIFNSLGAQVESNAIVDNEIYMGELYDGIYVIQVYTQESERVYTMKVVVNKN